MKELYLMGCVFFVLGVLMIVFRRPWGVWFCRLGKWTFRNSPYPEMADGDVYDEEKMPGRFLLLGIGLILEGPVFLFWVIFFRIRSDPSG